MNQKGKENVSSFSELPSEYSQILFPKGSLPFKCYGKQVSRPVIDHMRVNSSQSITLLCFEFLIAMMLISPKKQYSVRLRKLFSFTYSMQPSKFTLARDDCKRNTIQIQEQL